MQPTSSTPRRLVLPLGFALLCLVLSFFTFRSFGGSLPLEPLSYRVEVALPQGVSIVAGSDAQISGVDVGRVVGIDREGTRAIATLELDPRFTPLREGARTIVRAKSLLGEGFVEIAPGPASAAPVPEGGRLPLSSARRSVALDEFLETFRPGTRQRLRDLFAGIDEAFQGRGPAANEAFGQLAPFAVNSTTLLESLDAQTAQITRLLANSGDVFGALGERRGSLQAAITNADAMLDATASRNDELAATVRALPPFLDQLRATSTTIAAASGELTGAARALIPVAPAVRPALVAIHADAPEFRALFNDLPPTIAAAERGLPALERILASVPDASGGLYPAARELIPLLDLLGTYRREALIGPLANGASFTNGRIVGPGGKILGRGAGSATAWNESIGGYVKRLPTSRANPYPKPGGLGEIARSGFLKSFDCRHTGNALLVPPTGTGTPPCVTQGPWRYAGATKFYPRLQRAAP